VPTGRGSLELLDIAERCQSTSAVKNREKLRTEREIQWNEAVFFTHANPKTHTWKEQIYLTHLHPRVDQSDTH